MKTSKALLAIISILSVICGGCVIFRADNKPVGLVYHCTFDSKEAIEEPRVGPKGEFIGGDFVDGVKDKALLVAAKSCSAIVPMEAGFFGNKGCIEFWGRFDCKDNIVPRTGAAPCFFDCRKQGEVWKHTIMWCANNGGGGGGLCGAVQHYPATTDSFMSNVSYSKYLGNDSTKWHHYALVWNSDGIKSLVVSNSLPIRVAVYLDGVVVGTKTNVNIEKWDLNCFQTTDMILGFPTAKDSASFNKLAYEIDEFKIWNYDKVEF